MNIYIDVIFLVLFFLIMFVYINYNKFICLYVSIFTIFFSNFLIYVNNYSSLFMIKEVFISFTSLCIFTGIIYKCMAEPMNNILTWLVRLNIFILIFTVSNLFLQLLLLITTITTPYIRVKNSELNLSSTVIAVTSWMVLVTTTLFWYYNANMYIKYNNSFHLVLFSLFIPFIMHFYNNMYFESRAILLCLTLILDVFNHQKSIFDLTF